MAGSQNITSQGPHESGPLGQSGLNASGTVVRESRRDLVEPHQPQTESHRLASRTPTEGIDRPEIPIEVRGFCTQNGIDREVEEAIDLARQHFTLAREPRFEVVDDPEHGESYVGIHIWVCGQPDDVFRRRRAYSDSFADAVGREKRRLINIIYHAV